MNKELKPCPFCGSTNIDCADAGHKTDAWFIQCDDCGATFPHFDSEQEAREAWNKRVKIKPVKHKSKWIKKVEFDEPDFEYEDYECSNCGCIEPYKANYCSNCGAEMDTQ